MGKTLTLDGIINDIRGDDYGGINYGSYDEVKQDFLQWVADEVVGENIDLIQDSDALYSAGVGANAVRNQQRQILKDHGWKGVIDE